MKKQMKLIAFTLIFLFFNVITFLDVEIKNTRFNDPFIIEANANILPCSKSGNFYWGQYRNVVGAFCVNQDDQRCGQIETCTLDSNGAYCQEIKCV